jgi:hypothetical protein
MSSDQNEKISVKVISVGEEEDKKKEEENEYILYTVVIVFVLFNYYTTYLSVSPLNFIEMQPNFRMFQKEIECNYFSTPPPRVVCVVIASFSSDSLSLSFPYPSCS